ncbi:MAG TPA: CorA family divalent cation transporter [Rhizomicrobium sp.]
MDQILQKSNGLLWGLVFRDGRGVRMTDETYDERLCEPHDWVWMHFALSDHRARRFLEGFEALPAKARALLLASETRPQIHLGSGCAFGVLPDIERDFHGQTLGLGHVHFWFDAAHLITARHHPMRVVGEVRDEAEDGARLKSPTDAFVKLNEQFLEIVEQRLAVIEHGLDSIEDRLLTGREDLDQSALGGLRLEVSRYHRAFLALRNALHRVINARDPRSEDNPVWPHLPHMLQEAEDFDRDAGALQERARLLYEEMDTRIAAVTNRSLRTLTILSTLILPATLVTGAFGMNLPNIPWANTHGGFWWVVGLCVAIVAGCYAALRRFRIL